MPCLLAWSRPAEEAGGQAGHLPTGNPHWQSRLGELNWRSRTSRWGQIMLFVQASEVTLTSISPFPAWSLQIPTRPKFIWTYLYTKEQSSGPKPWMHFVLSQISDQQVAENLQESEGLARDPMTQFPCGELHTHQFIALKLNLSHCVWAIKMSILQGLLPPYLPSYNYLHFLL